jgi:transposase
LTIARLGLEAGPLSPWLHAGLRGTGLPAICIETRRMKGATAAMAVKTDRNDARAIAQAMRVGWFTVVHVKTEQSQELRLLLSNRRTLLEKRVAIDNEIRGTLKAFGLKISAVSVAGFEARVLELLADDPARFARSRDVGPHFGLTPRKYASGEIDRSGSITKAGDGGVRGALVQAALALLTRVRR